MPSRRDVLQIGAAAAALLAGAPVTRTLAQQKLTQDQLFKFEPLGNVTLLHVADLHGQLLPVYYREPSLSVGVGEGKGVPPHLTGADFLKYYGIAENSAAAYALSPENFAAL